MPDEPAPLAIDGGAPARSASWPPVTPVEPASDADPVAAFEAVLAERLELPAASVVMCADPAAAYRAALSVVPVGERNEVIVPSLLEREAADAARTVGWTVVPGEVDADTAALSVRGIARAMGDRTALAVVRHPFGHPAVMSELTRLAGERGVALVEDISGALGSSFRGAPAGRMGAVALFTGREGDPITGGACVIVQDPAIAARLRAEVTPPATDDVRLPLAQLRNLDAALEHRRHLAWELTFRLRGMRGVTPLPHGRWIRHAYARYVVRLRGLMWKRSLEDTLAALRAEGIPCEPACDTPLHLDADILGALPGDVRVGEDVFPIAARLPGELIALPLAGDLTSKDMDQVADALRKIEARSL
ncbi:MAG: DegT/DnrJ/EryC1/StrS family aminotransferase [Dehalococcoidia bacterium]|nr:DegT/DnrJ/EryC1/StrS family aminotransferase [Dehalococcoidia bacterium]